MSDAFLKTFIFVWPVTIVVALILFGVGSLIESQNGWLLGMSYVLGSLITTMMMSANYRSFLKTDNPARWVFITRRNYLLRYLVYGATLAFAYMNPNLEFLAVFGGFFTFKVTLLGLALFSNKENAHG
jgi:hypothetical protein